MSLSVGIVGAGVIGRLLALKGHARGWKVTLIDRGNADGKSGCSMVPPAMLAPYCELDVTEKAVADLGVESLKLWPIILQEFNLQVYFQQMGSLVVAHPYDAGELALFKRRVLAQTTAEVFYEVTTEKLSRLEPEIDPLFQNGLFFPHEGQIDSRGLMAEMGMALEGKVDCRFGCSVDTIKPHEIRVDNDLMRFDMVLDCRGYGAAIDIKDLRAVRGEILRLYAPGIHLNRPIRLVHPRWPLYIVPRPDGHFIIGATSIEAEDNSPISVRSTLELLTAAFTLNAGFSEARILETSVGLRPAFPDNKPRIEHQSGLIRINGMYRHGYLIAPIVTDIACRLIDDGKAHPNDDFLLRRAA
jgi:glycine oxidase